MTVLKSDTLVFLIHKTGIYILRGVRDTGTKYFLRLMQRLLKEGFANVFPLKKIQKTTPINSNGNLENENLRCKYSTAILIGHRKG
jgi:hypothetical protein